MDKNDLAAFIAYVAGIYQRKDTNTLDLETMEERCRKINAYGILSLSAIGAVIGCSAYRVDKAIVGMRKPTNRGKLNPQHLSMLAYMLSTGKINDLWLGVFLEEGTSLSTVSELTGISESTLQRHRRKLD